LSRWSEKEDTYLFINYVADGPDACAKKLGRKRSSVWDRASLLGLTNICNLHAQKEYDRAKKKRTATGWHSSFVYGEGKAIYKNMNAFSFGRELYEEDVKILTKQALNGGMGGKRIA